MEAKSKRDLRMVAAVLGVSVSVFVAGLGVARYMDRDDVQPLADPAAFETIQDEPVVELEESQPVSASRAPASGGRRGSAPRPSSSVIVIGSSGSGNQNSNDEQRRVDGDDDQPPVDGDDDQPPIEGNPGEDEEDNERVAPPGAEPCTHPACNRFAEPQP